MVGFPLQFVVSTLVVAFLRPGTLPAWRLFQAPVPIEKYIDTTAPLQVAGNENTTVDMAKNGKDFGNFGKGGKDKSNDGKGETNPPSGRKSKSKGHGGPDGDVPDGSASASLFQVTSPAPQVKVQPSSGARKGATLRLLVRGPPKLKVHRAYLDFIFAG